jgi:AraC-like DNA-binding protein
MHMAASVFIQKLIFSYGVVFLNFALAIFLIRRKKTIHYLGSALLADFGLMCVAGALTVSQNFNAFVPNLVVFVALVALGPLGSRFIHECFDDWAEVRKLVAVNCAVSSLVLALGVVGALLGVPWKFVYAAEYAVFSIFLVVIALYEGLALRPIRKLPRGLFWFYMIIVVDAVLTCLMCVSRLLDAFLPLYALWILQILSLFVITLIAFRAPETYKLIGYSAVRIKYSRIDSPLANDIASRLDSLMRKKDLYIDPDITLDSLASRLSVRPNQLSEVINVHLGQNFAAYVNSFRIERAKARLLAEPDRSVLEIGFACGFNSKSVFNDAFRKATGVTPTEFRRSARSKA